MRWILFALSLLIGGWMIWLLFARVTVYEVTEAARTELDGVVHPIESQATGMVVRTALALGSEIRTGEVLVELDARPQVLQVGEQRTRLAALEPELAALRRELEAERRLLETLQRGRRAAVTEAQSQHRETVAGVALAVKEAERASKLRVGAHVSELQEERARADLERQREGAEARRL